ncbi:divalent-cation tolerance protein CutA [Hirschia litorea]|uniref:Divalent-cation tolerance protein CutA n=1 Tax=Hirschia litorea TaxID=1199156 RepID=A0ABW2IL95_9PROT
MANILLIRINCPDDRCAAAIGETLIVKKLAGCVNIDGPVEAVYMWEDELVREDEWVVWAKAPQDNYSKIEAEVIDMHPHEIPAILALPCIESNARYADWLTTNTKS